MSDCRRRILPMIAVWLALQCAVDVAHGHSSSNSYLSIGVEDGTLRMRWDIALRDLELAVALDRDGDGSITWGELRRCFWSAICRMAPTR